MRLLFEFYDGNAGISFTEFTEAEGFYVLLAAQILMDALAESTGSFTVYDPDGT